MVVTNQAIFSVGDPQHETIGRTLQVPRMSESEVISAVSNLCVFKLFRQLIKNSSFHFVAETIFKIILYQ